MLYRVRQFWQTIHPTIKNEECEWVHTQLPPCAIPLFLAQPLPEQRHALDVAQDLWNSGLRDSHLIIAALLHDCGKTNRPLKVWERIFIVFLQKAPNRVWNILANSHSSISIILRTAEEHPQWGADMASEIGLDAEVVELIREHHAPHSEAGYLLYQTDNRH